MPSNIIQINNSKKLEWCVGDSKMEKLIAYLDEVGFRVKATKKVKAVEQAWG